ncbi:MAG TPA: hypothetical protein VGX97_08065 [bacterium]|nr:hypothetical protein [bacterium]
MASAFACDLTVFAPEQRDRLRGLVRKVFDACREAEELPDGYRLSFAGESGEPGAAAPGGGLALTIAAWISLERLCCPCIRFAMEFEEVRGPVAVRMTGRPGIKPFLLAEFGRRIAGKLPRAR